jgi:hypothetical protein
MSQSRLYLLSVTRDGRPWWRAGRNRKRTLRDHRMGVSRRGVIAKGNS